MYISRWFIRGYLLLALGFFVPDVATYYVSEHKLEFPEGLDPMVNAGLYVLAVTLIVLAGGQFQYAYYFVRLKDLLEESLSNKQEHRFITHNGEDAIVTKYYGGYYIEILTYDGFDKTVFVVKPRSIHAHQQIMQGALIFARSDGTTDTQSTLSDVVVLSPDYRNEMKQLAKALKDRSLP
jgi:hypothetical protein